MATASETVKPLQTIETARLRLRPLAKRDLGELARQANDWEVARWLSRMPHPYTNRDAREFYEGQTESLETRYAVVQREDDKFLGMIGHGPRPGTDRVSIGYWLGRDHWDRGYATEAGRAIIADAFARRAVDVLWVSHAVGNAASRRVIEKLGFEPAGTGHEFVRALGREVEVFFHSLSRAASTKKATG